jgi:hypothetical protein
LNLQVSYGRNSDQQHPTLQMVSDLLNSATLALERVGEEKYMLLNKVLLFLTCMVTNLLSQFCFNGLKYGENTLYLAK